MLSQGRQGRCRSRTRLRRRRPQAECRSSTADLDALDLHPKREDNFVWDQTEKFEASLYDHNFRKIKKDGTVPNLPIGDYEHVTCLELVALRRKGRGTQRYKRCVK